MAPLVTRSSMYRSGSRTSIRPSRVQRSAKGLKILGLSKILILLSRSLKALPTSVRIHSLTHSMLKAEIM
jgi:hypothetical protein